MKTKIQHSIAHNFGVDVNKIYLTSPTFFSLMTNAPAKTIHDEYWHPHVDKVIINKNIKKIIDLTALKKLCYLLIFDILILQL